MIFAVHGVHYRNKGAQLMLYAIKQRLEQQYPGCKVAISLRMTDSGDRRKDSLLSLLDFNTPRFPSFISAIEKIAHVLPHAVKTSTGVVTYGDCKAVLDASGFAYGDQWSTRQGDVSLGIQSRWITEKRKYVLLPQAFGPFERPESAEVVKRLVPKSTICFARDNTSFAYLKKVLGSTGKVHLSPDFTNLVAPSPGTKTLGPRTAAFVPNYRMIERLDHADGEKYINLLATSVTLTEDAGLTPLFVIHETTKDARVVRRVEQIVGKNLEIISENDPIELKRLLGTAHLVFGSRFHALVGSLCQAVPTIGAGWSHKYSELFSSYGIPECLLPVSCSKDELSLILDRLLNDTTRPAYIARLHASAEQQKQDVKGMWRRVFDAIEQ